MTTQWFLDDLGLSEDSSETNARPAAAWPRPPQDLAADPDSVAQKCLHALKDDLNRGQWASEACERQWHRAQAIHPEAGSLFEAGLLDALIHTRLPHRRALFLAAYKLCRWSDAEHIQSLGTNGPWIALVLAQEAAMRAAYATLPPAVKLLRLLEGDDDRIPERTLAQWPRMREIFLTYAQYLSLTIDSARFKAWDGAYRELQARPVATSPVPPSPPPIPAMSSSASPAIPSANIVRPRPAQVQRPSWVSWMIKRRGALIMFTVGLCVGAYLVARITAPTERSVQPSYVAPSPSLILTLPAQTKTSVENCDYIDLVVHQPTWKLPEAAEQRQRFAEVITGCMKVNHWHTRSSPDATLERLGVHA